MTSRGFNFIETITFAMLLEILVALIVPRFSHLAAEARATTVREIEGAMRSAACIAHMTQVVSNRSLNEEIIIQGRIRALFLHS
jgi:hypothetical protein